MEKLLDLLILPLGYVPKGTILEVFLFFRINLQIFEQFFPRCFDLGARRPGSSVQLAETAADMLAQIKTKMISTCWRAIKFLWVDSEKKGKVPLQSLYLLKNPSHFSKNMFLYLPKYLSENLS